MAVKIKGIGRGNHPNSLAQGRKNRKPGWKKPGPGRPKGSIEARKQLMLALKGEAPGLLKRLVRLAKQGDAAALRTLLAPLIAPAKDNVLTYKFVTDRKTMEDVIVEMENLEKNLSAGAVDKGEAETISKVLMRHKELIEQAGTGDRRTAFEKEAVALRFIQGDRRAFELASALVRRLQALERKAIAAGEISGPVEHPLTDVARRAVAGGSKR